MERNSWPKVAVLGAGAVGSYFGGMLARAGAPVTLVGRAPHVDAVTEGGLLLETKRSRERIRKDRRIHPRPKSGKLKMGGFYSW